MSNLHRPHIDDFFLVRIAESTHREAYNSENDK